MEAAKDTFWITVFAVSLVVGAVLVAIGKRLGYDMGEAGL